MTSSTPEPTPTCEWDDNPAVELTTITFPTGGVYTFPQCHEHAVQVAWDKFDPEYVGTTVTATPINQEK